VERYIRALDNTQDTNQLQRGVKGGLGPLRVKLAQLMGAVTLSPNFQVVIPQIIRKALDPGSQERLRLSRHAIRIAFMPKRPKMPR
jgi:hypothetical protein